MDNSKRPFKDWKGHSSLIEHFVRTGDPEALRELELRRDERGDPGAVVTREFKAAVKGEETRCPFTGVTAVAVALLLCLCLAGCAGDDGRTEVRGLRTEVTAQPAAVPQSSALSPQSSSHCPDGHCWRTLDTHQYIGSDGTLSN